MRLLLPAALLVLANAALPFAALPAHAQDDTANAARRAVIERDQQSEYFSLQLRQSQREIALPAGSAARRALEALHLEQRQQTENLQSVQLREAALPAATPADQAARESAFERERRAKDLEFGVQLKPSAPAAK